LLLRPAVAEPAQAPAKAKKDAALKIVKQKPTETGALDANGAYQLGPTELKFDCKKLTGRIQLRLLSLRDAGAVEPSSAAARAIHGVAGAALGGSTARSDPDADKRRDRAMVEAYNRQLAAKGCKTFDLEAELKKPPGLDTPTASGPRRRTD
jgi:hypothetical protein